MLDVKLPPDVSSYVLPKFILKLTWAVINKGQAKLLGKYEPEIRQKGKNTDKCYLLLLFNS